MRFTLFITILIILCFLCLPNQIFQKKHDKVCSSELEISFFDYLNDFSLKSFNSLPKNHQHFYEFYKTLFIKNFQTKRDYSSKKIPPVIHWIWIGDRPFPSSSTKKVTSWAQMHPEWKLKFWTDDINRPCPLEKMEKHLIKELDLGSLQTFYDQSDNPGEQSDLIRYVILENEGGLYVDHDVSCFTAFDKMHACYDFYSCLEPVFLELKPDFMIGNCIIGVKPHHPIMKTTISNAAKKCQTVRNNPKSKNDKPQTRAELISRVMSTTFSSFSLAVYSSIDQNNNIDIVFPAGFFFSTTLTRKLDKLYRFKQLGARPCLHTFDGLWALDDKGI